MAKTNILKTLENPSVETARSFFDWTVDRKPIFSEDGLPIMGYSEFRSSKGDTLHVGNSSYSPWQPKMALELTLAALNHLNMPHELVNAGTYDQDSNIFAQFSLNDGNGFTLANGKTVKDLLTMAKGNDEKIPFCVWLTLVMIVCKNTWRAVLRARKGNNLKVSVRQTQNSDTRVQETAEKIVATLQQKETVQDTLNRMASTRITIDDAQRAFLGLIRREDLDDNGNQKPVDLSKTGKTHLVNSLDRFDNAFKFGPGADITSREGWFAGVTNLSTHGKTDSKAFNPDKQFVNSEFKSGSQRKALAFELASDDTAFAGLVQSGSELLTQLLDRPVILTGGSIMQGTDFARLLEKN